MTNSRSWKLFTSGGLATSFMGSKSASRTHRAAAHNRQCDLAEAAHRRQPDPETQLDKNYFPKPCRFHFLQWYELRPQTQATRPATKFRRNATPFAELHRRCAINEPPPNPHPNPSARAMTAQVMLFIAHLIVVSRALLNGTMQHQHQLPVERVKQHPSVPNPGGSTGPPAAPAAPSSSPDFERATVST